MPYVWSIKSGWSGAVSPRLRNSYTPLSGVELKSPQMIMGICLPLAYLGGVTPDSGCVCVGMRAKRLPIVSSCSMSIAA